AVAHENNRNFVSPDLARALPSPVSTFWYRGRGRRRSRPSIPSDPIGGAPMVKTEIKTAIDQHAHSVRGVRHQFKLQWAALEPRWSSRAARYLLAIDVISEARGGSSTVPCGTAAGE